MRRLIGLFTILATVMACEKEADDSIQTITFGTYYGECGGTCYQSFSFKEGVFAWEQRSYVQGDLLDVCQGVQDESVWAELLNNFNLVAFVGLDEVIGCRDCADGGASFIEIEKDGEQWRVTFETGIPPAAMEPFHQKISDFSEEITNLSECQ